MHGHMNVKFFPSISALPSQHHSTDPPYACIYPFWYLICASASLNNALKYLKLVDVWVDIGISPTE
jgi:hypothetical protein